MSVGRGVLWLHGSFEAEYTAASFGGSVDWALQTIFEGWIKHLSEGFSEISGKYKPYHLGEAVRVSH